MGKTYDQAPNEVRDRVMDLIRRFHPDLELVKIRIDLLMASTDAEDAHAITHGGYPALAVVKILGPKERAMERGDAEIVIDRDAYEAMSGEQRDALLDHELYHLEIKRDKAGLPKRDDHQRPLLKMRKHDVQVGWFAEIARRHKEHSHEVRQATEIFEESGQLYFGFAQSGGTAAELQFYKPAESGRNPVTAFVNTVRNSGASVTIRAGEHAVKIDKDGVHAEPTKAQLERATEIAQRDGKLTRSGLQRLMSLSYNAACAVVDRLVAMKVITPSEDPHTFTTVAAPAAA
jgi:hypothetical protein